MTAQKRTIFSALLSATALVAAVAIDSNDALATMNLTQVAGTGSQTTSGGSITQTQTSTKAVYTSTNLNAAAADTLDIEMANANPTGSIALINVTGGKTTFNGTLFSEGRVWIINPDGMLFHGAQIAVSSLLLSTAGLTDPTNTGFFNSPNENYDFNVAGSPTASITLDNTLVFASGVPNKGADIMIQAPAVRIINGSRLLTTGGNISLLAGQTFTVDFNGDGLLNFEAINVPVSQKVTGATSSIEVSGGSTVDAGFGTTTIGAVAFQDAVLDHVINLGGQTDNHTVTNPPTVVAMTNYTTNNTNAIINPTIANASPDQFTTNFRAYYEIIPPSTPPASTPTLTFNNDIIIPPLTRVLASFSDETVKDTVVDPAVANVAYERPYLVSLNDSVDNGTLTLAMADTGNATGGSPTNLNGLSPAGLANLAPAAGGDETSPQALNGLAPAAGGNGSAVSCANTALANPLGKC